MATCPIRHLPTDMIGHILDIEIASYAEFEYRSPWKRQIFLSKCLWISRCWAQLARDRLYRRPLLGENGMPAFYLMSTRRCHEATTDRLITLALSADFSLLSESITPQQMRFLLSRMKSTVEEISLPDSYDFTTVCLQGMREYSNLRSLDLRCTGVTLLPLLRTLRRMSHLHTLKFGSEITWHSPPEEAQNTQSLEELKHEARAIPMTPKVEYIEWVEIMDDEDEIEMLGVVLDIWSQSIRKLHVGGESRILFEPTYPPDTPDNDLMFELLRKCPRLEKLILSAKDVGTFLKRARLRFKDSSLHPVCSIRMLSVLFESRQLDVLTKEMLEWIQSPILRQLQCICFHFGFNLVPPVTLQIDPSDDARISSDLRTPLKQIYTSLQQHAKEAQASGQDESKAVGIWVSGNVVSRRNKAASADGNEGVPPFISGFQRGKTDPQEAQKEAIDFSSIIVLTEQSIDLDNDGFHDDILPTHALV